MLRKTSSLILKLFGHDPCILLKYAMFYYAFVNTDLQYVVQADVQLCALNQCELMLPEAEGFFPSSWTFNNTSNTKLTAKYLEINTSKNQISCRMSTL